MDHVRPMVPISNLLSRHSRERGNPDFPRVRLLKVWIPTSVGMTVLSGAASDAIGDV